MRQAVEDSQRCQLAQVLSRFLPGGQQSAARNNGRGKKEDGSRNNRQPSASRWSRLGLPICGPVKVESSFDSIIAGSELDDIGRFYTAVNFDPVPQGDFTRLKKLGTGITGNVFEYAWKQENGECRVAVKKFRREELRPRNISERYEWRNKITTSVEDGLAEIGTLQNLAKQPDLSSHILRLEAVFADTLNVWLITEVADGGELFQIAADGTATAADIRIWGRQLLEAVSFLHKHNVGHRDISLENILLKDRAVKLMDFGQAVRSHDINGAPLRFFRSAGKEFYRAPECYVPKQEVTTLVAPVDSAAGDVVMAPVDSRMCEVRLPETAVAGKSCRANLVGYTVPPADVFSSAICLLILSTGRPPWNVARPTDAGFAKAMKGQSLLLSAMKLQPQAEDTLKQMLQLDPRHRPSAETCLQTSWFADEPEQN